MAWLVPKIVIAEYALGVILPLVLGLLSLRAAPSLAQIALGGWLVGIAANYVPLLIYAVLIARAGTVQQEGAPELARARRYGVQQIVILVPGLVLLLALVQKWQR
jgi:hypothetical protein